MKKLLMDHQTHSLLAPYLFPEVRFHFFVAGYSTGKTSAIASSIEFAAVALQGKRDYEGRKPRGLVCGLSIGHLLKTTVGYVIEDCNNAGIQYKYDKKDNILEIGDFKLFLVSGMEPDRIIGEDVAIVWVDEADEFGLQSGDDKTFEAIKACNERLRQGIKGYRSPWAQLSSTSQGQKGLYRVYCMFKKNGTGFTLLRGRSQDNIFIRRKDPLYLESMQKLLSRKEIRVLLEGHFEALGSGMVCPDFDWDKNFMMLDIDLEVGVNETVYVSMDFNTGYCRATAFIVRMGIIYGIKYYDFPNPRESPKVWRHDFPQAKIYFIPDNSSNKEVLTYFRELRNYDIHWIIRSKNPSVEDSVFITNKLLYTQRLIFTNAARESAEACAGLARDKNHQVPKGTGPQSLVHAFDGIRYVCEYLVKNSPVFLDILRISMGRHTKEAEETVLIEEQKDGYVKINPR